MYPLCPIGQLDVILEPVRQHWIHRYKNYYLAMWCTYDVILDVEGKCS